MDSGRSAQWLDPTHSRPSSTVREVASEGRRSEGEGSEGVSTPTTTHRSSALQFVQKRQSPVEVSSAAQKRVSSLEAAMAALGDDPEPAVLKTLQEALKKAKQHATPIPVGGPVGLLCQVRRASAQSLEQGRCGPFGSGEQLRWKLAADLARGEADEMWEMQRLQSIIDSLQCELSQLKRATCLRIRHRWRR